ncbi:MAG: hypothetical protein AAB883_02980 [Patescibacteria group bacterium]
MTTEQVQKWPRPLSYRMAAPVPYRVQCFQPSHPLVKETETIEDRLARLSVVDDGKRDKKKVDRIFLPNVGVMSARRNHFTEFDSKRVLSNGVELYGSYKPADVVAIRKRQGVFFQAGGCLLVVATAEEYCVAGHVGRESLIRPPGAEREYESVVNAIAESFDRKGIARENIVLRAYFGIQPRVFPHDPTYPGREALYENLLAKAGSIQSRVRKKERVKKWNQNDFILEVIGGIPHLNLYLLLKAQALLEDIERIAFEKPLPINGDFAYTRHTNPELARARNSVFVYRE